MGNGAQARRCPPHPEEAEGAVEQERLRHGDAADMERRALGPEEVRQGEGNADQRTQQRHTDLPADITPRHAVGEHAADQGADSRPDAAHHAHQESGLLQIEAVGTDQEARAPGADGVAGNRRRAAGEYQAQERGHAKQLDEGLEPAILLRRDVAQRHCALGRPHGQQQKQAQENAGRADQQEGVAPAVVLGDPAAQAQANYRPQAGTEHQHRQGSGTAVRRVQIRDHGHRRRRTASLTNGHADPRQNQGQKAARHAAEHGHQAPGDAAEGDHRLAPDAVRQAPQREAEHGVEHCEGHPRQQADAGVGNAEFELHRFDQDRHQLAVDVVEHIDAGEHEQRVVRSPCHGGLVHCGCSRFCSGCRDARLVAVFFHRPFRPSFSSPAGLL
ncbi:hypothetical protein PS685_05103 [Pseudomonas fluorescens]|uniref:Uncharacterized protein n=1 Tax=Pseudomonas fluorescens TaxID=294 RepID=A0A5E7A0A9_PSEFL|nr:hypothetical protein PS685_05103 [Pseudomonas fluorescens]